MILHHISQELLDSKYFSTFLFISMFNFIKKLPISATISFFSFLFFIPQLLLDRYLWDYRFQDIALNNIKNTYLDLLFNSWILVTALVLLVLIAELVVYGYFLLKGKKIPFTWYYLG